MGEGHGMASMKDGLTLAEFLEARFTEDEEAARWASHVIETHGGDRWEVVTGLARYDPPRVLAKCKANRDIVHWITAVQAFTADGDPTGYEARAASALTFPLRLLALPYADHPDWREEWRP